MNMGFEIVEGPEVETVFMNFDALNAGPNHPSRDLTDTFYITDNTILRTQTSPVQARTLLTKEPPMKVISPGRVYRCDTPDATHSPVFHQVEGLVVGEGITMADLKGTLGEFARQMFGPDTLTKFRPHHFRLLNRAPKSMYPVLNVEAKAASDVRAAAGLRFSAAVWCIERPQSRRHRYGEVYGFRIWNRCGATLCSNTRWMISGCSTKTTNVS